METQLLQFVRDLPESSKGIRASEFPASASFSFEGILIMKRCSKCKQFKELDQFYKCSDNSDGRQTTCIECKKAYRKVYCKTESGKAVKARASAKYKKSITGKFTIARYRRTAKSKRTQAKDQAKYRQTEKGKQNKVRYRKNNLLKYAARQALCYAVRNGKIIKPKTCSICGENTQKQKLHGHHDDYNKPLDVIWVCKKCHRNLHNKKNEII